MKKFPIFRKLYTAALVCCFLFGVSLTIRAFAADGKGFEISDDSAGYLEITSVDPKEDIKNLAPGDRKESGLKLENNGGSNMAVYIKTDVSNEVSPNGGSLADAATIEIKVRGSGETLMSARSFRAANGESFKVATLTPGESLILDFFFYFPETSGNSWQESSMDVKWVFTTSYVSGVVDTPPPQTSDPPVITDPPVTSDPPVTDDPFTDITEGDVPGADAPVSPELDTSVTVVAPNTGDRAPIALYVLLVALSLCGLAALLLLKNRSEGKRK